MTGGADAIVKENAGRNSLYFKQLRCYNLTRWHETSRAEKYGPAWGDPVPSGSGKSTLVCEFLLDRVGVRREWRTKPEVAAESFRHRVRPRCPGVETRRAGAIHPSIPSVGRPADCTQHTVDRSIDRVNGLELKCLLRGPMRHSPLSRINQTHRHRRPGVRRLLVHMTYEPRDVTPGGP